MFYSFSSPGISARIPVRGPFGIFRTEHTHTHKDPYKIFWFKTLFNDLLTRAPQEPAGSLKENSCKDLWKMICLQKDLLKDLRIRKL